MSTTWRGLDVDGVAVTVRGGDDRALPVCRELLEAGALVTVDAEVLSDGLTDLVDRGLVARATDDAGSPGLVVALTDGPVPAGVPVWRPSGASRTSSAPSATSAPSAASESEMESSRPAGPGQVVLVGGGPGDPGLLTRAGYDAVLDADVVVYDRLAPVSVLADLDPAVELIDVSKVPRGPFTPQERINRILVEQALAGRRVVRLKGGDSFVFGRGGEEVQDCLDAGVPVRVIPGVTSAVAAPELAGIPVTHRAVSQGFVVVSGHVPPGDPRSSVDWAALARSGLTIVILMGVATLPAIAAELVAAGGAVTADTPVATVCDAGTASQRVVRSTLGAVAHHLPEGIASPAVTVVGQVAGLGWPV